MVILIARYKIKPDVDEEELAHLELPPITALYRSELGRQTATPDGQFAP
jgi:hypothetical protein